MYIRVNVVSAKCFSAKCNFWKVFFREVHRFSFVGLLVPNLMHLLFVRWLFIILLSGVPERQKGKGGGSFFKGHFQYCTHSHYHQHCRNTVKQLNISPKSKYLVRRINSKK